MKQEEERFMNQKETIWRGDFLVFLLISLLYYINNYMLNRIIAGYSESLGGSGQMNGLISGAMSAVALFFIKDLDADVTGRHILLVEDIIDTGITLAYLKDYLGNRGAESVKICALLDKPTRRERAVPVDYMGFTMPDEFLIGYGVDYAENYRNLPYVASLSRSVYEK